MDAQFVNNKNLPESLRNQPIEEPKLDAGAIPDLDVLLTNVLEMLHYMDTPEMINFAKTNEVLYEQHLDTKFECISSKYYNIFKLLLDAGNREKNLAKIIEIFSILKQVKNGNLDIHKA